eukprot:c8008_g1_i1.p1 GENE.c8008_g1_i1~~c8008_g1_i1.p1  ORF type:complete len:233 (-),score=72.55 c8008_g1_i1:2-700(-)
MSTRKTVTVDKKAPSTKQLQSQNTEAQVQPPLQPVTRQGSTKKKSIGKTKWCDLRDNINDLKIKWEEIDPQQKGIPMTIFKKFCRENGVEAPPMTVNTIMSDTKGTFGELISQLILDQEETDFQNLNFDEQTLEFHKFDINNDGIINGTEFTTMITEFNVPQEVADDAYPYLTFVDFLEYKVTGVFQKTKGLDGFYRAFNELEKFNRKNKKHPGYEEWMLKLAKPIPKKEIK